MKQQKTNVLKPERLQSDRHAKTRPENMLEKVRREEIQKL